QMSLFATVISMMILFYFFQTAMNPLTNSLILHSIQGTKQTFGSFRLWGSIGFAIMVLAASPLIQWSGVENLGYMYGSFLLITLLLAFRLPKQGKKSAAQRFSGRELFRLLSRPLFVFFLVLTVLISIPNQMNSIFISVFISD